MRKSSNNLVIVFLLNSVARDFVHSKECLLASNSKDNIDDDNDNNDDDDHVDDVTICNYLLWVVKIWRKNSNQLNVSEECLQHFEQNKDLSMAGCFIFIKHTFNFMYTQQHFFL